MAPTKELSPSLAFTNKQRRRKEKPKKMTKGWSIWQKKLHELESLLTEVFAQSPDQTDSYHLNYYIQDIEQRFVFLKTLLSAEMASSPRKPHHLQHIGDRLVELETAFHEWDECGGNMMQAHVETVSKNDDGETCADVGSVGFDDPVNEFDGLMEEKGLVKMENIKANDLKGKEEGVSRFCWSMACGVVIGMVFMGFVTLKVCGCFPYVEQYYVCLSPT